MTTRWIHLNTILACILLSAGTLEAVCPGAGDCEYSSDPGRFKVTGLDDFGESGHPLLRLDSDGTIKDGIVVEFLNTSMPSCDLDIEDTNGVYQGVDGCGFDESTPQFSWHAYDGLVGFRAIDNKHSSTGESIQLKPDQTLVFPRSGIYEITRTFETEQCDTNNGGCNRDAVVTIEVERDLPTDGTPRIHFDLPADNTASVETAATQEWWAGNGISGCSQLFTDPPPTPVLSLCGSSDPLPNKIDVYGTIEYCGVISSTFQKWGPDDSAWVDFDTGASTSKIEELVPTGAGTTLIRRRDVREDGSTTSTNTLTITVGAQPPSVVIGPAVQSACTEGTFSPIGLEIPVATSHPVRYQWFRHRFDLVPPRDVRINGATDSTYTPTALDDVSEFFLVVTLDDRDPARTCAGANGSVRSGNVRLIRTDDAETYYEDDDGDGYPDRRSLPIRRCEPEPGYALGSLPWDCNDFDADIKPTSVWYEDADGDGYVDIDSALQICQSPSPTAILATSVVQWVDDCDDSDPNVTVKIRYYRDFDGDGYPANINFLGCSDPGPAYRTLEELVSTEIDCDDNDAEVHPGSEWIADADGDGFGDRSDVIVGCSRPDGYALASKLSAGGDCDDSDETLGGPTLYFRDRDGDGFRENVQLPALPFRIACSPPGPNWKPQSEFENTAIVDCDDRNAEAYPGRTWYPDADGDGAGDSFADTVESCQAVAGLVANRDDCDDSDASVQQCSPSRDRGTALSTGENPMIASITQDLGDFGVEDFSVEFWMRTDNPENAFIISKDFPGNDTMRWGVAILDGKVALLAATRFETQLAEGQSIVNDGNWHHLTFRRRGQTLSLFVDGVQEVSETQSSSFDITSDQWVFIGGNANWPESGGPAGAFIGEMDELRIWGVARTGLEIELGMHTTLAGDEEGLLGYWQFNETVSKGEAVYALDRAGSNHFQLNGVRGELHESTASLVDSTAPFGGGQASFSEYVPEVTEEEVGFVGTALWIEAPMIVEAESLSAVATEIEETPSNTGGLPGEAAQQAYYVLSLLDVGAQEVVGDLLVDEDGDGGGAGSVSLYHLFTRPRHGDGPWEEVATSQAVRAGDIVFSQVTLVAAQYFVTEELIDVNEDPVFRRGDSDGNGGVDLTDAISTLGFLFLGGAQPECLDAADTNDSGAVDLSDAVSVLNYLFLGGPAPATPGPQTCGEDPAGESLGCSTYESC